MGLSVCIIGKCWLVGWLVDWSVDRSSFSLTGFRPYDNVYECVHCCNRCHGSAVKEFWASWDNICMLTNLDSPFTL
jgi:hypothetical protein